MWDLWWTKWCWGRIPRVLRFSCQSSFHQLLHNHHHLSSGAGSGRSSKWTKSHPTKKNKKKRTNVPTYDGPWGCVNTELSVHSSPEDCKRWRFNRRAISSRRTWTALLIARAFRLSLCDSVEGRTPRGHRLSVWTFGQTPMRSDKITWVHLLQNKMKCCSV
jgi:hypothetical protein